MRATALQDLLQETRTATQTSRVWSPRPVQLWGVSLTIQKLPTVPGAHLSRGTSYLPDNSLFMMTLTGRMEFRSFLACSVRHDCTNRDRIVTSGVSGLRKDRNKSRVGHSDWNVPLQTELWWDQTWASRTRPGRHYFSQTALKQKKIAASQCGTIFKAIVPLVPCWVCVTCFYQKPK